MQAVHLNMFSSCRTARRSSRQDEASGSATLSGRCRIARCSSMQAAPQQELGEMGRSKPWRLYADMHQLEPLQQAYLMAEK